MKIAYFDCFAGAGGDMIIASLLDAGLDRDFLAAQLKTLGFEFELKISCVMRCGIRASRFEPICPHQHHHRHLPDITKIIESSGISAFAKAHAIKVFTRLAAAEAKIHKIDAHEVHFHEVGAVDSIIDIVAACIAFEKCGFEKIYASPLAVGGGTVKTEHGLMPVPAPATAELLKNVPVVSGPQQHELLTPTAAAILTTFVESFGPMPSMAISATGYGAGSFNSADMPNVLRVIIGETTNASGGESDSVMLLEANCDDTTGEIAGYMLETVMELGALDAFITPIYMKHSRPAFMFSVLCNPADAMKYETFIFEQGLTLGIRKQLINRSKLARKFETVSTEFGEVKIKLGYLGNKVVFCKPEFANCAHLAQKRGGNIRDVINAAMRAYESISRT